MPTWEEETRKKMALVKADLDNAINQLHEAEYKVQALTREYDAFETALTWHLKQSGFIQDGASSLAIERLRDLPNLESRLIQFAKLNNRVIKVSPVADIFYTKGIIKGKTRMHVYRQIYSTITELVEKGQFQKVEPATFQLTNHTDINNKVEEANVIQR